jgi:hypothetical protein
MADPGMTAWRTRHYREFARSKKSLVTRVNFWSPRPSARIRFDLGYPPDLAARIQAEVKAVIASTQPVVNATPLTGANGKTRVYESRSACRS